MSEQPTRDPVIDLLDTTQRETQDLVGALCQVHTDRVKDLLTRDLRDQMSQVIMERFSQLELALRPRMARARLEVARGITQVLSDAFTRMRRFESDRHWCDALLDAAGSMSRRSAFFSIRESKLCWQGVRGFSGMLHAPATEVHLKSAPAFDRVAETGTAAQAARSAADLSGPVVEVFGEEPSSRVLLTPVSAEERVLGILYAEDPVDPSAMQAIAAFAGLVLERHLRVIEPARNSAGTVRAAVVVEPGAERSEDPAAARAKRFARVQVARMMLDSEEAVVRGRMSADLYGALRRQIDGVRAAYRAQFNGSRDYLHEEMLRTLARDNPALLGAEYPGPLS